MQFPLTATATHEIVPLFVSTNTGESGHDTVFTQPIDDAVAISHITIRNSLANETYRSARTRSQHTIPIGREI